MSATATAIVDPIGCWPVDEPFPAALHDADLMRVTGYGHSQFYKLKARGVFRFLELRPALDAKRTLYSGVLIRQWVRGELGGSRYFKTAAAQTADVLAFGHRRPGRPRKHRSHEQQDAPAAVGSASQRVGAHR